MPSRTRVSTRRRIIGSAIVLVSVSSAIAFQNCSGLFSSQIPHKLTSPSSTISGSNTASSAPTDAACSETLATGPALPASASYDTSPGFDIIIVAGQSNAVGAGYGDFTADQKAEDTSSNDLLDRIYQFGRWGADNGNIVPVASADADLNHRLQFWWNNIAKTKGLSTVFAKYYAAKYLKPGRNVLIVPVAHGGSSILRWQPEVDIWDLNSEINPVDNSVSYQNLYVDMRARITNALHPANGPAQNRNRIVAFLWHQGEGDIGCAAYPDVNTYACRNALMPNENIYEHRLRAVFRRVREDFSGEGLFPIISGEQAPEWPVRYEGSNPSMRNFLGAAPTSIQGDPVSTIPTAEQWKIKFKNIQMKVAKDLANVSFVTTEDLTSNGADTPDVERSPILGAASAAYPVKIHFDAKSQYDLARRYFLAYQAALPLRSTPLKTSLGPSSAYASWLKNIHQQLAKCQVTPSSLATGLAALMRGEACSSLLMTISTTPNFSTMLLKGDDDAEFLHRLALALIGRPLSPSEAISWSDRISRLGRATTLAIFLAQPEVNRFCQNPTTESEPLAPTLAANAPMQDFLAVARTTKGGFILDDHQQWGAYVSGGVLNAPNSEQLSSSFAFLAQTGFQTSRIMLGPNFPTEYGYRTSPHSLADLLAIPDVRKALANPQFKVVTLTSYDFFSNDGAQFLNPTFLSKQNNRQAIFDEYYVYYSKLFSDYSGVKPSKVFVVSNWEGDNQIYCKSYNYALSKDFRATCDAAHLSNFGTSDPHVLLASFADWQLIRKAALLKARLNAGATSDVKIHFAVEFNQVNTLSDRGLPSVLRDTLSTIQPDLVFYSSYESLDNFAFTTDLETIRDLLNQAGLQATKIGIGELGFFATDALSISPRDRQRRGYRENLPVVSFHEEIPLVYLWNAVNKASCNPAHPDGDNCYGFYQPDQTPYIAPNTDPLIPEIGSAITVGTTAAIAYIDVAGHFPSTYAFQPKVFINCNGVDGSMKSRHELISLLVVNSNSEKIRAALPPYVKNLNCVARVESELGFPSRWSESFTVTY